MKCSALTILIIKPGSHSIIEWSFNSELYLVEILVYKPFIEAKQRK